MQNLQFSAGDWVSAPKASQGRRGMTPPDAALEAEINLAALRLQTAPTPRERRDAWNTLCELQSQQKEQEQGLVRTAHG
jgi:hypothetical protein